MSEQASLFGPTLAEARATVAAALVPGAAPVACPACDRVVELHERRLRPAWMRVLASLAAAREQGEGWVLLDNAHATGAAAARDWSLLRFWLLIERHPERAATWRATETGLAFVYEGTRQPLVAYVWNNTLRGFGPERVTFTQASRVAQPVRRRAA